MPLLDNLELRLDVDAVLRGQGADPAIIHGRNPRLVQVAERALTAGRPLVRPAVLYKEFAVAALHHEQLHLSGGATLHGELVARHLGPAEKVIAVVCTIGADLEKYATEAMLSDPVYGLALDGVGAAAVEALANAACQQFAEWAAAEGMRTTAPLSPGMAGWPLAAGQLQIFALLQAEQVSVVLTEHALMVPCKSLSMVLGVGRDVEHTGRPCDYCTMRDNCRYRS